MKGFRTWLPGRFLTIALGGVGLGYMAAAAFCQSRPTVYRSSVLVAGNGYGIERAPLAPVHAALIRRDWEDDFQQPLTLPGGDLSRSVTFLASSYGVEVEVLSDDPKKGIGLAVQAAGLFRGMEHEIALAAMDPSIVPRANEDQRRERGDAIQLRTLLNQNAVAAGFPDAFSVRDQAKQGVTKAVELWNSESFRGRWTMFEELATRIGIDGVPGDPLTAPPVILARNIEDPGYPTARIDLWLDRGMKIGLLVGLVAAFFLARRGPEVAATGEGPSRELLADW